MATTEHGFPLPPDVTPISEFAAIIRAQSTALEAARADLARLVGATAVAPQDVAGALALDGLAGAYELTLTGPTQVSITGAAPVLGFLVAIRVHRRGYPLTVQGRQINLDVDDQTIGVQYWSDGWSLMTGALPPDLTPPTAGALAISADVTTATGTVTGAMDDSVLHATPYAFSRDAGATWSPWQEAATYTWTGLSAGTEYTFRHRVQDAAGNLKTGASVTATTATVPTWATGATWAFTAADGTALDALAPTTGNATLSAPAGAGETLDVRGNRGHIRASGGLVFVTMRPAAPYARGIGLSVDLTLDATSIVIATVSTNANNSNSIGFQINPNGTVELYKYASVDATYTPATGAPTVPKTASIRMEWSTNPDGSKTGRLWTGSTLVGTVAATGWDGWSGGYASLQVGSNAVDSYLDNLTLLGAAT